MESKHKHCVIVCGGRDFDNSPALMSFLDDYHDRTPITLLVQGGARGADRMAKTWAIATGVAHVQVDANWAQHGKAAGPIRNQAMLSSYKPDAVIAFPGGAGTAHMCTIAAGAKVPVVAVACAPTRTTPIPSAAVKE